MELNGFAAEEAIWGRQSQERQLLFVVTLFVLTNAVTLSLAENGTLAWIHFTGPAVWLAVLIGAHVVLTRYRPLRDPFLLPVYFLLTGWGLILVDRLAPNFLLRQAVWLILATVVLLGAAVLPPGLRWLRRYRYTWLTIGLVLVVATFLFGVNPSGAGTTLWLPVPFFTRVFFQPSELLKLLLVVFLASYFDEQENLTQLRKFGLLRRQAVVLAPLLLMWGFCILLLAWQRDLGAATLFFLVFLALLYLTTGRWLYVLGGLAMLILSGVIGYLAFDVVELRVDAWLDPWPEASGRAFQIVQSLYAIAAGGVTGQGVGQGSPTYIPVVHSDFAFAAIVEEWGLVGGFAVLACFATLCHRGFRVALIPRRPFQAYLSTGISVLFGAQAFLIMAGVTKLLPLTGVTLPFVSYGGSSLLVSGLMVGLLVYLSAVRRTGS